MSNVFQAYKLSNFQAQNTRYLGGHMWGLETKLVHDPSSFDPIGSSVLVEHQGLSHPHNLTDCRVQNSTILPCSFPVSRYCSAIGSESGGIFPVTKAEEIPLRCIELSHL